MVTLITSHVLSVSDLLMQSARCRARASRSSRVVCIEPASDREGETFCEFKQTNTSNSSIKTSEKLNLNYKHR